MSGARFSSFVSVVLHVCVLLFAPSALAEAGRAPPRCEAMALPRYSTVVPANVPALVAMQTATAEGSQRVTLTSFAVIDGAPTETPSADAFERSSDGRISGVTSFAPKAPLPADTAFEATFAVDCAGIDTTTTARFTTGGPKDLPTTIGTVTTRAGDAPQGIELLVDATPELLAFLPVTMLEIETRVGFVLVASYGQAQPADGDRVRVRTPAVFPLELCAANDVGSHVEAMSLHAHVAGATSDPPPVAFDVAIGCERPKPASVVPTSRTGGAPDAGDAGGCTTSPSAAHSAWTMLVLGALVVVVSRARRSSR